MICSLPFTYYARPYLRILENLGTPLMMIYPSRCFIGDQMKSGLAQGLLDIRTPEGIDEARLDQVLTEYRAWADLHQRNLDTLAGFFSTRQHPAPFVDETDPTQIRSQLNRYGQPGPDSAQQGLMQAAVFMAMAHEFDTHQNTLSEELADIGKIERQMFQHLSGDAEDFQSFPAGDGGAQEESLIDPGLYLTNKRVQAWATLARTTVSEPLLFLTPSEAVFSLLCDVFSRAVPLVEWTLEPPSPQETGPLLSEQQMTHLKELARAKTFADVATPSVERPADGNLGPRLVVYGLETCSPGAFLSRLAGSFNPPEADSPDGPGVNTLFGYLEVIG